MTVPRLDAVYICPWSLQDPLCQSQTLPYLRGIAAEGVRFALITFEQRQFAAPLVEAAEARAALAADGLEWFPLPYRSASMGGASKAFDIASAASLAAFLVLTRGARLVHSRSTLPAAAALMASTATRCRFFYDADGPLAQEYVDVGAWREGGPVHRTATWVEDRCFRAADACAVLADTRRREVSHLSRMPIDVLPCAVDTRRFAPTDPAERGATRSRLGLAGLVLVYVGKAGGWYAERDLFAFAAAVQRLRNDVSVLVVTRGSRDVFEGLASEFGVRMTVVSARSEEVPSLLGAADVGLCFLQPFPSKRGSSAVKLGEYLAVGLPVVTSAIAGDYPDWVKERGTGVVIEDAPGVAALDRGARELLALLDTAGLTGRCRATALDLVDLERVVLPRYVRIYARLLQGG